jgi:pimeloyl-ACP methyl ester carboxylesterase
MRLQARSHRGLGIIGLVVVLATTLMSCSLSTLAVAPTPTPHKAPFDKTACQFSLGSGFVDGKNVFCGNLVVPEDRSNPSSPNIRLAVATFKTPSASPAPDPLIFLQGGPGGRIIKDVGEAITGGHLDLQSQFGNHDLILVDQRGTGYSTPSLQCPEVVKLQFLTDQNLTADQLAAQQNQALDACHTRLTASGVNLSAYTTYSDANDIHDLIDSLGYQQVDIYGVSYGTRLALELMRAFPQHIRSVVLDSSVPPQMHLLTNIPSSTARVLNTLFQGCAADASCNAKYPHLDTVFYSLVTVLNAHPVTFDTTDYATGKSYTVLFHGDDLFNVVFTSFYVTEAIPLLPGIIYQTQNGDYRGASLLYGSLLFDDSVSWGMYYSVECAEDVDSLTPDQVTAAGQAYPSAIRQDQVIGLKAEFQGCKEWNVKTAPGSEASAVTSAIPTLVMESEYDPVTPPTNGDLVARTLSASYKFEFPGVGHGAMLFENCPTTMALAFWAKPGQKPDSSCIASMGEPQFS